MAAAGNNGGNGGKFLQWGSLLLSVLALTFAAGTQWGGKDAPLIGKVDINSQRLDHQGKLIDNLEKLAGDNSVRVERLVEQFAGFRVTREMILGDWIKRQEQQQKQIEGLQQEMHRVENLARGWSSPPPAERR